MKEMKNYANTMKVKKAFLGGYDKNDVHAKINHLISMAEKREKEYEAKEKEMAEALEQKVLEQQKMKEAYKGYCAELLKQYSNSLKVLSAEFTKILDDVSDLQKGIVEETVFEGLENAFTLESLPEPDVNAEES